MIVAGEGEIGPRHLPCLIAPPPPSAALAAQDGETLQVRIGDRLSDVEEAYIRLVLKYTNNNKTRTAEIVGVSLRTLHNKLHAYAEQKAMTAGAVTV